jgi:hypothetical protein
MWTILLPGSSAGLLCKNQTEKVSGWRPACLDHTQPVAFCHWSHGLDSEAEFLQWGNQLKGSWTWEIL